VALASRGALSRLSVWRTVALSGAAVNMEGVWMMMG